MNETPASPRPAATVPQLLVSRLRAALAAAGDPDRARAQQAYMKSALPYYGVTSPELKALLRPLLTSFRPTTREKWDETVRSLWDGATHREGRYAAVAFAQHPGATKWRDPDALALYEPLISTGAWWDLVDVVASDLVGPVLLKYRRKTTPLIRDWATGD
ncbi:MAG: DNA alkylation repair protein, partial [Propionibacteriaceae bacterium]